MRDRTTDHARSFRFAVNMRLDWVTVDVIISKRRAHDGIHAIVATKFPEPTMVKLPLPSERSILFKMLLLVNLNARPFDRLWERRFNIRLQEWRVVRTLAREPGLTATELSMLLAMDKMAISRAVRRLEELDRVVRVVDPADHRRSHLKLTEAGAELYRTISPHGFAREELMLTPLTPDDRVIFEGLLDRLLEQARLGPNDALREYGDIETDGAETDAAEADEPGPGGADRRRG